MLILLGFLEVSANNYPQVFTASAKWGEFDDFNKKESPLSV
jgi:hypothetical protein